MVATIALLAVASATGLMQASFSNQTTAAAVDSSADARWFNVATPDGVTVAVGIGFANEKVGYFAGGANGAGTEILKTEDAGVTWDVIPGINFGLDILLLGAEAAKNTVIVTSIFGELYSINGGKNWSKSIGGGLSQSIRYIGGIGKGDGLHFGIVGIHGGKQGCAITNNAGITFKAYPASPTLFTSARYGVYPDSNTWYISAGTFPANPPPPPPSPQAPTKVKGGFRKYVHQDDDGKWLPVEEILARSAAPPAPPQGWSAQIVKTKDAGKSWTSEFSLNNSYYFNEIDCAPGLANHCCAVAEDSINGHILCTTDGENWKETWTGTGTPGKHVYTVMGLEFVSAKEAWACGGTIGVPVSPLFLHTTDGGATWNPVKTDLDLIGNVCLALDMLASADGVGYAAMDNVGRQQASVAKYSTGPAPPPPPPPPGPSPAPPGKTHYEDPNAGNCLPDEKAIQITGLQGSFCSPNCDTSTPCPTDVPTGTTATPKCVLESQGSQSPTNCALICTPSALAGGCPDKASCKAIQGTGLCTYDN